jgi:alcohol dehydrogenase class IV
VLLSAVLKYNAPVNGALQERVLSILWGSIPDALSAAGLERNKADAGDAVRAFVSELGLPTTLKEAGVEDETKIEHVAKNSLDDVWGKTNPRKLKGKEDVLAILRKVA